MRPVNARSTSPLPQSEINRERANAFAQRMIQVLNNGAIAMMTSIGHRTGLFNVMSQLEPSSTAAIAQEARLDKRYVQEWLGAMVTGGVVDYDATSGKYSLPVEHAAFLTPAATPNNLSVPAQFLSILGSVEDKIVACFRSGGGVPYSEYGRFHQVMAEESSQTVGSALLSLILPLVPGLRQRLQNGVSVLDVGCGSGRTVNLMAEEFPGSTFIGYDLSEEAIAKARKDAAQRGLINADFAVKDVAQLTDAAQYDLITAFDAIHDQAGPQRVLENIARALKPDGVFLMQEISGSSYIENNMDLPLAPFGYTISCMHCMTVSLAQDGEGLGAMWGEEQAREMLKKAGFTSIEVNHLPHDILNSYFVVRR